MLEDVKNALRIGGDDFNSEIDDLINAAKSDLESSGVAASTVNDSTNMLVKNAIINFCKAEFGYDNTESDRFKQSYESLKTKLVIHNS